MTDVVVSRRRLLGGVAALFAVAAAPALAVPRIAPDTDAGLDFEVMHEEWIPNPNDFGFVYRCVVRFGSHQCFAAATVADTTLALRNAARKEAWGYAKLWFAAEKENQNRIR